MNVDAKIIWLAIGVVTIALEFLAPGLIIIFFGLGALLTAVTTWMGFTESLNAQLITFLLSSLIMLFGLRSFFKKWFVGESGHELPGTDDDYIGKEVRVMKDINNSHTGRVEIKGSLWNAKSLNEVDIAEGELVKIIRREGLTFFVKK